MFAGSAAGAMGYGGALTGAMAGSYGGAAGGALAGGAAGAAGGAASGLSIGQMIGLGVQLASPVLSAVTSSRIDIPSTQPVAPDVIQEDPLQTLKLETSPYAIDEANARKRSRDEAFAKLREQEAGRIASSMVATRNAYKDPRSYLLGSGSALDRLGGSTAARSRFRFATA